MGVVGCGALLRIAYHRPRNGQLGLLSIPRNLFHCLSDLLARAFTVKRKAGQLPQQLHRTADGLN